MARTRHKIVLLDDDMTSLNIGRDMLKTFHEVYPANTAVKLFEILEKIIPELILLDIEMPEMNGYDVIKKLKADPRFAGIPVIFLTSKSDAGSEMEGFDLGAVDYISKPFSAPLLLKRITNQLLIAQHQRDLLASRELLKNYATDLEKKMRDKAKEVVNLQNTILLTVSNMVEYRDKLTGGHIARTQLYMQVLVEEMMRTQVYKDEVSHWEIDFFLPSVQLHDVGKISIPDGILNKQDELTQEEFEIMKSHVTVGVDAIERIMSSATEHNFLRHTLYIVGTHHEKWDGTGYPVGLKGHDIPIEGRLMAIADVYDALIATRPYKKGFPHETAHKIMLDGAGTHFDPALMEVYLGVADEFARIAREIGVR
jgi:putative two-component system response regulator